MTLENLKKYRKTLGKTQEEMANTWGISVSFYKQIECGAKNPSLDSVKLFKKNFPTANIDTIFLS